MPVASLHAGVRHHPFVTAPKRLFYHIRSIQILYVHEEEGLLVAVRDAECIVCANLNAELQSVGRLQGKPHRLNRNVVDKAI
jgi:hypothetical protein